MRINERLDELLAKADDIYNLSIEDGDTFRRRCVCQKKRKGVFDDSSSKSSKENEFGNETSSRGAKFRKNMKTLFDDEAEESDDNSDD